MFGDTVHCVPSCRKVDFRYQQRLTPDPVADDNGWRGTVFFLYYNQIEVQHSWERVLYDINNIVASVGFFRKKVSNFRKLNCLF